MFKFTITQNSSDLLNIEMSGELNTVAAQGYRQSDCAIPTPPSTMSLSLFASRQILTWSNLPMQ